MKIPPRITLAACAALLALSPPELARAAVAQRRAAPSSLEFATARHVYLRGEPAKLELKVAATPPGAWVEFDTGGWLATRVPAADEAVYTIDTALLRAGDYDVRARLVQDGQELGQARFALTIAPERNPQRYPVYRWHAIPPANFAWWRSRGFNGFVSPRVLDPLTGDSDAEIQHLLDESARMGFDAGCYLNPFLATRGNWQAEALVQAAPAPQKSARREKLYPRAPDVVAYSEAVARSWVDRFSDFPAWKHALLTTEYQIPQNYSPLSRELAKAEAGVDLARLGALDERSQLHRVVGGLIDDDDPYYRYLKWWWHTGIGDARVNQRMAEIIKARRSDVLTWHDPYRLAPVRDVNLGLDAVSTWTYAHPDTRRLLYTAALQALARPAQQKVMQTITLFLYGRFVVPLQRSTAVLGRDEGGSDPFFTAGPDFAREATWLAFSQRPDLLCYYNHSTQSPHLTTRDPDVISPETFDAIGETVNVLVEPYGPMVLAARCPAAPVAVLMSAVSEWFGQTPRHVGWANEQFLPYVALLAMNHVPFEVLLDDDILEGALSRYSTLVLPRPATMTRKMHAAILAFVQHGGRVIADSSLRAPIPGVVLTSYNFATQNQVDGGALAAGRAVTAEEDRATQERYAAELKPHLAHIARPAEASSPRVVINTLEAGAARLVFLVNADKTYGPRFGQHRLHMEEGVRLGADVRIRLAGKPTLYDVLAHKPIAYESKEGHAVFRTELPAARGKLIAIFPEEFGTPDIDVPAGVKPGTVLPIRITLRTKSGQPLAVPHPIRIEVVDPLGRRSGYTRYAACADGSYVLPFRPALNDAPGTWSVRVTELIAGKSAEATFAR